MWHDMHWNGWGHHMFSWWGVIVMGILIVAVTFIILRSKNEQQRQATANDAPLDVLERRYASGEIDREEFQRKKREIQA